MKSLSYRNQSINLLCKSLGWFLYDIYFHHERVNDLNYFCKKHYTIKVDTGISRKARILDMSNLSCNVVRSWKTMRSCLFVRQDVGPFVYDSSSSATMHQDFLEFGMLCQCSEFRKATGCFFRKAFILWELVAKWTKIAPQIAPLSS